MELKFNPNTRRIIVCESCGKKKEHHAKGMCFNCYRNKAWKRKIIICAHCKRERPHQARGMCASCHNKLFHYQGIKNANYRKYHNISIELYEKVTKKCQLCSFDKIIELHHLDKNRKNSSENNLIGLCPNHHKLIHDYRFSEEIVKQLKNKGFNAKVTSL